MVKKNKFYVVWEGLELGIYSFWIECQWQIKGYIGVKYKGFFMWEEVEDVYLGQYKDYIKSSSKGVGKGKLKLFFKDVNIVWDSIFVDVVCVGNLGVMEY